MQQACGLFTLQTVLPTTRHLRAERRARSDLSDMSAGQRQGADIAGRAHAARGAAPSQDWKPQDVTPDLGETMPREMLEAARGSVMGCFGVLPALFDKATTGPLVREAQRHLAGWMLQPVAALLAEEASDKLGREIVIDVMRPVQAYDVGGRARALSTMIEGLARAKELGLSPDEVNEALALVNWGENDNAA